MCIRDRAEEVQQLDEEEPEVIPQEIPPEISRPATLMPLEGMNFMEILRATMEEVLKETNKKLDESSQSNRETNKSIESLKADLNNKIEETSRSTNQKIEEGQKESQKNMELLKEELNDKINETNRRMEDGQKKTEEPVSYTHLIVKFGVINLLNIR